MLTSINPLGERGRNQSFPITFGFYLVGSMLGALTTGALVILVTGQTGTMPIGLPAVALVVAAVAEFRGWKVPSIRRQVDRQWLTRYRGWVYGLGFGFQLGTGFMTIVTSWSLYLYLIALTTVESPMGVLVAVTVFGVNRALAVLLVRSVRDPAGLRELMRRMEIAYPRVRSLTSLALGLIGLAGVGSLMVS